MSLFKKSAPEEPLPRPVYRRRAHGGSAPTSGSSAVSAVISDDTVSSSSCGGTSSSPPVQIAVDGREMTVPSSWTILRACREHGIRVPTLCHHVGLPPTGRCGACTVQVTSVASPGSSARLVLGCKTHVAPGMRVVTSSPEVRHASAVAVQEFLGPHRPLQMLARCGAPEIEELSSLLLNAEEVVPESKRPYAIVRDQSLCISCTRCVRACGAVQNMNVLAINPESPAAPIVFEGGRPLHATQCIACGQCAVVCPTGAVSERDDTGIVFEELTKAGPQRRTVVVMTAPSARFSLGEMFGEVPGTSSPAKTIAGLRAAGFDLVFDTTFGADITATLEATELVERVKAGGPLPMFTSCCPGWVNLVEKKFEHLRGHLSRCRSPMMMLGAMIRYWMHREGVRRDRYFVVALMPCTAKKVEIERPELRAPDGTKDVDVVLTVREMGKLLKTLGVSWSELPGEHKTEYDDPFASASGGGSLFAVSGGVTEAALRVAHAVLARRDVTKKNSDIFEECRRVAVSESVHKAEIDVTPSSRSRRTLSVAILSGSRKIQDFLEDLGLDQQAPTGGVSVSQPYHFIECMACGGGCIGGGGQPSTLEMHALEMRRKAVYAVDAESTHQTSSRAQHSFIRDMFGSITSDVARELLEYEPPSPKSVPLAPKDRTRSFGSVSSWSSSSGSCKTLGDIAILYGSQSGSTTAHAKYLAEVLKRSVSCTVSCHSMDHFPYKQLPDVRTLLLLTSTWEGEHGLMPYNAIEFYHKLVTSKPIMFRELLLQTKFAVCGFGSPKYTYYCGFATQLHDAFVTLGAFPFEDTCKINVDVADKGKSKFSKWVKRVVSCLARSELPSPKYLLVPSLSTGSSKTSLPSAPGYQYVTVTKVKQYKEDLKSRYFFVEFNTDRTNIRTTEVEYVHVLPCNNRTDVESLINSLYPNMYKLTISLVPISSASIWPPNGRLRCALRWV
uniref:Fe-only hydrogenase 9 n=1 Tax=Mastigamoeba balamuthi TaxID=108607 RepID=A0A0B4R3K2_MASBA|nr:Fe-only hydrogenase 9 [Mastigamoeba balamuthi]